MKRSLKGAFKYLSPQRVTMRIKCLVDVLMSWRKWKALAASSSIKLELGSGVKKGSNGWTTVDLYGADISHDLKRGIPLPDGSVDKIYTSHMLEHIPYGNLIDFINECHRVLKNKGELSVCVPNAGLYIQAYVDERQFLENGQGYRPAFVKTGSFLDQVNYIAYMDGHHHYMFDEKNLVKTLKKSAFSLVTLREFDPSLDLKSRDFESIYASAVKMSE